MQTPRAPPSVSARDVSATSAGDAGRHFNGEVTLPWAHWRRMSMRLPLDAKIYVAGHGSPLGRMLCRKLDAGGYRNVVTREVHELNLRNQLDVNLFFEQELPDYVFLVNDHTSGQVAQMLNPAEFLYGQLLGLSNVIHASYVYEVRKLLNIIFTVDGAAGAFGSAAADVLGSIWLTCMLAGGCCCCVELATWWADRFR